MQEGGFLTAVVKPLSLYDYYPTIWVPLLTAVRRSKMLYNNCMITTVLRSLLKTPLFSYSSIQLDGLPEQ
jgi:hypothetical protein